MNLLQKNVLVVGMARSGIDAALLLHAKGALVSVYDGKQASDVENIDMVYEFARTCYFGVEPSDIASFDLIVMSPGVPPWLPFLLKASELGIEIIAEVELAYRLARGKFVAITGTNGKTTTTTLVGQMYAQAGFRTFVVGNIGLPISRVVLEDNHPNNIYVTELSSYQLEGISSFKPAYAALLNITPDHLARHKTMENYTEAKLKVVQNIEEIEHFVLNADDPLTRGLMDRFARAQWFSKFDKRAQYGLELIDDVRWIVIRPNPMQSSENIQVLPVSDVFLLGEHNLENALAAVALAYKGGVPISVIAKVLKEFQGVEHRNEFVAHINGIDFYNDSKATNPEASIPAIKAMVKPTILIAGGMDKGSDYTTMLPYFGMIKYVVLFGETRHDIAKVLDENGHSNYCIVGSLAEAVAAAKDQANPGDAVLLSPACASWDMFKSFEERGTLYKELVRALEA